MQQPHAGGVRRQTSPIGAGFSPEHATGKLQLFGKPLPPAHPPGLFRAYQDEMLDKPQLKAVMQSLGTNPKDVLNAMERGPPPLVPSPRQLLCSRPLCCLLGMAVFLALLLLVWMLVARSASPAPTPLLMAHPSAASVIPLWVRSVTPPRCGRAGIRQGSEDCEPDLDALVNPVELEKWRRGRCRAPDSLSQWVRLRFFLFLTTIRFATRWWKKVQADAWLTTIWWSSISVSFALAC
jgi:hypothetical protein